VLHRQGVKVEEDDLPTPPPPLDWRNAEAVEIFHLCQDQVKFPPEQGQTFVIDMASVCAVAYCLKVGNMSDCLDRVRYIWSEIYKDVGQERKPTAQKLSSSQRK